MGFSKFAADLRHLREALTSGRLAVLCGAGISAPPPAELPLASAFVRQTIAHMLYPYDSQLSSLTLRPEMLFSYLFKKNASATLDTISHILEASAFNIIHDFCAQVLAYRGVVISTNFDLAIECAATARRVRYSRSTSYCRTADAVLFKIHGSLDERPSIGLTIDQVGAGLGRRRSKSLERLLRERTVIVLGYSGNDQLDIMPALRATAYSRIIWIDHVGIGRWRRVRPPTPELALINRAIFWRGQTLDIVKALAPLPLVSGQCLSPCVQSAPVDSSLTAEERSKVAVEILMHENRYDEVVSFINSLPTRDDLQLRIAHFEATSSISQRPSDWTAQRDQFLDDLFDASQDVQTEFLPTMAKYNARRDRLQLLHNLEKHALKSRDVLEKQIEAAIETLYELIHHHLLREAETLSVSIDVALKRRPNLLLRGRLAIERAYLCAQRYCIAATDPGFLRDGIAACEEAKYLLGPEICNDEFFFNQARSNLGWLRSLEGEFRLAEHELMAARRYFLGVSVNNYLTQWFLLAQLRRAEANFADAYRLLKSFASINRRSGREYWLGFAWREQAVNAAALGVAQARVRQIFQASIRNFIEKENGEEAELTRQIERRLLDMGEVPPNLLTKPFGRAWLTDLYGGP